MKVIDAFWEKRNLDMNVAEIDFAENDKEYDKSVEGNYQYIVAKVPKGNIYICNILESNGYKFIEAQLELTRKISDVDKYMGSYNNFIAKFSYKIIVKDEDLLKLIEKINENMFISDRISLDENFGREVSCRRYRNWIKDEFLKTNSIVVEVMNDNKSIGFFLVRKRENYCATSLLGGIFDEYRNSGLGIVMESMVVKFCKNSSIKRLETNVSSNNINAINMHLAFGSKIRNIKYSSQSL